MFIKDDLFVFGFIFPIVMSQNTLTNKNQIITLNQNSKFGSYLAGLIEGGGSIYVPDNIRNNKGKLNQANIDFRLVKNIKI